MKTLNENFMESSAIKAREGLLAMTKTNLLSGINLYRFGSVKKPDLLCTGPWWISFSPFEELKRYAQIRQQSLSLAARTCLAVDWEWSDLDVLVKVIVKEPLSAWSGTPKTQTPKKPIELLQNHELTTDPRRLQLSVEADLMRKGKKEDNKKNYKYTGSRWEPDRNITQLFIPCLYEADPNDSKRKIWQSAFSGPWYEYIREI